VRVGCGVVDHAIDVRGFREFREEGLFVETRRDAALYVNEAALQCEPQRRLFAPVGGVVDIGEPPLDGVGDLRIVEVRVRQTATAFHPAAIAALDPVMTVVEPFLLGLEWT
jgi:hypothetical protein